MSLTRACGQTLMLCGMVLARGAWAINITDMFSAMSQPGDAPAVCISETNNQKLSFVPAQEGVDCQAPASVAEVANNRCPKLNRFLREHPFEISQGVDYSTDNFAINLDWEFRLKPSFRSEAFLRTDIWTPRILLRAPWDKFSFSIDRNGRFVYTTSHPNACAAANPLRAKTPFDMPKTAQKALLEMRTNDYVRVDMESNFTINGGTFSELFDLSGSPFGINASAYYVLSGGFQIHINKLDPSHVRLWIVTDPSETLGVELRAGLSSVPEISGVRYLDRSMVRIFRLRDLLSATASRQLSLITLFDTTLDLANPEAANAYDKALNGFLKLDFPNVGELIRAVPEAIVDRSFFDLANKLYELPINDLGPLYELARGNARRDNCAPGTGQGTTEPCLPSSVVLNNDISNRATTGRRSWRVGISEVLSTEHDTVFRTNHVTEKVYQSGAPDRNNYYVIPTWQKNIHDESLFSQSSQRVIRQANAIFRSDANWSPIQFTTMAFGYTERDTSFAEGEMRRLLQKVQRLIPSEYAELEAYLRENNWLSFPGGEKRGVEVQLKYTFKEAGYLALFGDPRFSRSSSLADIIKRYFGMLEENHLLPYNRSAVSYYERIERLSRTLSDVFNPQLDSTQRYQRFARLRESSFFVDFGPGILVHLAQSTGGDPKELMSFRLALFGRTERPVEYKFGEDNSQELADVLAFTEDILNQLDNDGVVVFGESAPNPEPLR